MPRSNFTLLGWVIVFNGKTVPTGNRGGRTSKVYKSSAQAQAVVTRLGLKGTRVVAAYGIRDEVDAVP